MAPREESGGDGVDRLGIRRAWSWPATDPGWPTKVIVGGCLVLLWPLVVPAALGLGYLTATARRAGEGSAGLPRWRPIAPLLRDGWRLLGGLGLYGWPVLLALGTFVVGPLVLNGPLTGTAVAQPLAWLAAGLQPVGLLWAVVVFLLFPLLLRQATLAVPWVRAFSPASLWRLGRAAGMDLAFLWGRQAILLLMAGAGLLLALVGYAFTLFWALLGVAVLVGGTLDL